MNNTINNCGCGPSQPSIPSLPILNPFDPTNINFISEVPEITLPEIDIEGASLPDNWFEFIRDAIQNENKSFTPDPYDPYISNEFITILPTNNERGLGTLSEVLNSIADEYPSIPDEIREELRNNFDAIANNYWDGLSPEEQQEVLDEFNSGGGGGGGSVGGPGGGAAGVAGSASISSALASINAVLSSILSLVPSIAIYINLDILQPYLAIAATIRAGVQVLNLFSALVAGVDVSVDLGLSQLIELLNPLTAANFNPGPLKLKIPIIPTFGMGTGLSVSLNGIRSGINFGVMGSIGLSGSLGLDAGAIAALSGPAPISAAVTAKLAVEAGGEANLEVVTPSVPGNIAAPGGGKIPGLSGIQSLSKNQKPALTELVEFGGKNLSYDELMKKEIEKNIKINIVPSIPGSTNSIITFSNVCSSGDCIVNNTRMKGLRDALNKSKAAEDAIIYMFNLVNIPYQTKITLSELILKVLGWDTNIPIDPTILQLMSFNLPAEIKLNVAYVMMTMGKSEPPDVALYLA